jgi:hypothetical protein
MKTVPIHKIFIELDEVEYINSRYLWRQNGHLLRHL